jgi:F0F1-type ATP synthase assembly protein I
MSDAEKEEEKENDAENPSKPSVLLNWHRETVKTSTGMSPAVMLGSSFALAMGIFAGIGHVVDLRHNSEPWGVLGGVAVGLLYGAYEVWKVTRPGTESTKPSDGSDRSDKPDAP